MHRLSYHPPLWSGLHALNQLCLDAIKIMIAIVTKLMPEFIGVILATRSHDWVVELFERIELRGRHQTAGSAARPEKPCGYRFRHTHKGLSASIANCANALNETSVQTMPDKTSQIA